jgi:hypothetical protein
MYDPTSLITSMDYCTLGSSTQATITVLSLERRKYGGDGAHEVWVLLEKREREEH